MKRTSTLQVGPVLREENEHTVKRETLNEEASRQLAASIRAGREIDEAVSQAAQRIVNGLDEMVVQSFQPGHYLQPVERQEDLSADAPEGSLCYAIDTAQIFARTGQAWVLYNVEAEGPTRFLRADESG